MASPTQDAKLVAKWQPALESLFTSKKNFSFVNIISMSPRNLLILSNDNSSSPSSSPSASAPSSTPDRSSQTQTRQRVVFKVAPMNGCLFSEIVCLSHVSHPNIVAMKEWWSDEKFVFVALEHVLGRCVIDLVVEQGRLTEQITLLIIRQIVSAVVHLHSRGFVHRDIKPDNFIFNVQTGQAKLIDFELSTHFMKGSKLSQRSGTIHYLSPEVRRQCYEGPECDAWSLGVSVYVMISGQFPYSNDELWSHQDAMMGKKALKEEGTSSSGAASNRSKSFGVSRVMERLLSIKK
eukprot:TRINITY_DN2068_c1_g1_i1.p1 TRINITY_DN2068_c1_g1~~TRINITY_DN2068_c1_g1_i1.p1  ORF type:complete len:292 (+),score=53.11 TRINITY_DN2068_c1_g1_i1:218-1093(+)